MGNQERMMQDLLSLRKTCVSDLFMSKNPKYTMWRLGIVTFLAVLILFVVDLLLTPFEPFHDITPYYYAVIAFNLVSEGNILINRYFDKHSPWFFKVLPRIVKQLSWSLLWTAIVGIMGYILIPKNHYEPELFRKTFSLIFIFGALFVLIFNAILFIRSFIENWKSSFEENEKIKREKLKSDYIALQNQLNPHFLFNSLSVLISEIRFDPPKAEEFARKMSDVYRYVLQCKDVMTISLRKELQFIEKYIYLHQIRLGGAVHLEISIPDEMKETMIPPLTLQLLIENALKHNVVNQKQPLTISISCNDQGQLVVTNNLQTKKTTFSTGTGLTNLSERYRLLSGHEISFGPNENEYKVVLPLLDE